jgi:hypothetical protein
LLTDFIATIPTVWDQLLQALVLDFKQDFKLYLQLGEALSPKSSFVQYRLQSFWSVP